MTRVTLGALAFGACLAVGLLCCSSFSGEEPTSAPEDGGTEDGGRPTDDAGVRTEDAGADANGGGARGIAFVQATTAQSANQPGLDAAFDVPAQAHALLVVAVSVDTTGAADSVPPTVNDEQGDTFEVNAVVTSPPWAHLIFSAADVKPGVVHISVRSKGNLPAPVMLAYAHEYSGVARTGAFVTSQVRQNPCATPNADCMQTAPMNAPARSLLFGYAVNRKVQAGSGFTQRATRNDNITEDRVVDVPLAYPVTASMVVAGEGSAILGAVFQP